MANLVPAAANQLATVPQLDLSTLAQGGPGGPMNAQAQAIINTLAFMLAPPTNPVAANGNVTAYTDNVVDTTGGIIVQTLPSTPSDGQWADFSDGKGNFHVNKLTVARSGTATIMGLAQDMDVTTRYAAFRLRYVASSNDWRLK